MIDCVGEDDLLSRLHTYNLQTGTVKRVHSVFILRHIHKIAKRDC